MQAGFIRLVGLCNSVFSIRSESFANLIRHILARDPKPLKILLVATLRSTIRMQTSRLFFTMRTFVSLCSPVTSSAQPQHMMPSGAFFPLAVASGISRSCDGIDIPAMLGVVKVQFGGWLIASPPPRFSCSSPALPSQLFAPRTLAVRRVLIEVFPCS